MQGGPPPPAAVDADGEDAEEEEEAGHAEAHLIDRGVAHQGLAVLPCVQLLTHLIVERDLSENHNQTTPSSHHTHVGTRTARVSLERRSAAPNTSFAGCHASKGAKRESRRQTTPPLSLQEAPFHPAFSTGC